MAQVLPQIKHIVVVMLENRSFDNLCGWIYSDPQGPQPSLFLPAGSPAVYDGLNASFWNPANKSYFDANEPPVKVAVVQGTTGYTVPSPDPEETFDNVTFQLYGPQGPSPSPTWPMQGFVVNYEETMAASPNQIMQTYSPAQLPAVDPRWPEISRSPMPGSVRSPARRGPTGRSFTPVRRTAT